MCIRDRSEEWKENAKEWRAEAERLGATAEDGESEEETATESDGE